LLLLHESIAELPFERRIYRDIILFQQPVVGAEKIHCRRFSVQVSNADLPIQRQYLNETPQRGG
jgi:hypothetical protein